MTFEPPTAEGLLRKEDQEANEKAEGIATIGSQIEEEGEIDDGTDDGL